MPTLIAGLATTGIVAVATGSTSAPGVAAAPAPSVASTTPTAVPTPQALVREQRPNRSQVRSVLPDRAAEPKKKAAPAKPKAAPAKRKAAPARQAPPLRVVARKYTRAAVNVRAAADADSRQLTVLGSGAKVRVTATVREGWRYISYRGKGAWVKNRFLVDSKPQPKPVAKAKVSAKAKAKAAPKAKTSSRSGRVSSAACPGGSAVERGLTPDAIRLHRTMCARFPAVKSYGGLRADGQSYHSSGRALDIMVSGAAGWEIARFARANAKRLGISEVLYAQKIWTVQRSSEGWRSVADRGSVSANHYDHVHVSVYGNSAG